MNEVAAPLVSIVIPCYNHIDFVQDSIQSVIDQTYQNIELIIIDDGSKDESVLKIKEMIEKCERRFTRFEFRHRSNKGLSATLNEALEWCQGEYFSVIASDDRMLEDKTQVQVHHFLDNKNCIGVCGGTEIIDESGTVLNRIISKKKSYSFDEIIMLKHDLPAPTQMVRLKCVKETGGYNVKVKLEDWYMWLLLSKKGELHYIPQILSQYRSHENNTFKQISTMYDGRIQVLSFYTDEPLYQRAKKRVGGLKACELSLQSKGKAFKEMAKILKESPLDVFSYDFIRFVYWLSIK